MSEKEKTVEVMLSRKHTVGDVEYKKGDIVEVGISDIPRMEDFGVLEEGSIRPAGTQKREQEEATAQEQAELDRRINAFDAQGNIDLSKPASELAKLKPAQEPAVVTDVGGATTGKKKENT